MLATRTTPELDRLDDEPITLRSANVPAEPAAISPAAGFSDLNLSEPVARALADMGYTQPTPIQSEAIPALLAGDDLVGRAKTGTGKTAAFGIPLIEKMVASPVTLQALVLVPTRELAKQVADEVTRIGWHKGIRVLPVYGGEPIDKQLKQLVNGVHVVVGTPGRIIDHMRRGTISFADVTYVVLDECDAMLDIGFADDIETILRRTPKSRQTALLSATIPLFVRRLIWKYLRDPVAVEIEPEEMTVDLVDQVYYEVAGRDKARALISILDGLRGDERILIFRRTQRDVDRLTAQLWDHGFEIRALHGGMRQEQRTKVMDDFRTGALQLLVATNVAARGIDIEGITHVVNFDMPDNIEDYVHRIGRTARAGRTGTAITMVGEWDFQMLEQLLKHMKGRMRRGELSIYRSAT